MENKLLQSFLEQPVNQNLYLEYLQNPNENIKNTIEKRFKIHVMKIKILSYFSKVFYFEAQKFDKKIRENSLRNILIMDKDDDGEWVTYNDVSHFSNDILETFNEDSSEQHSPENLFEDKKLFNLIANLSEKNKELLYLLYVKDLDESEVASFLNVSKQAINKRKNNLLKKIRTLYEEGR